MPSSGSVSGLFPGGICRWIARRLPLVLLTVVASAAGHFYLLTFKNNGIFKKDYQHHFLLNTKDASQYRFADPVTGSLVSPSFSVQPLRRSDGSRYTALERPETVPPFAARLKAAFFIGNFPSSFVIWTSASLFLWSALYSLIRCGPIAGVARFASRPLQWLRWISQCRQRDWGALLIGCGLFGWLLSGLKINSQASLCLLATSAFFTASPAGRILSTAIYQVLPARLKGLRSRSKFSLRSAYLVTAGLPLATLATVGYQSTNGWPNLQRPLPSPLTLGLIAAGLAIFMSGRLRSGLQRIAASRTSTLLCGLGSVGVIWLLSLRHGFAHDGGFPEFQGKSTGEFLQTQGALENLIHAGAAAIGTALGPLVPEMDREPLPDEAQRSNRISGVQVRISPAKFLG